MPSPRISDSMSRFLVKKMTFLYVLYIITRNNGVKRMISIIVAMDENQLIGKKESKNGMPWNNAEDLKHFKETTLNQTIVMGKTTYQAIGRPLPSRHTIVLSKKGLDDSRVELRDSLDDVIDEYRKMNKDLFICGGASIYKQALPLVDELIISRIPGCYDGETYFPSFQEYHFELKEVKHYQTFQLEIYKRGRV